MANKLMKKCLTSLVIMKMQIKGVKWQVLGNTWSNWNFHIVSSESVVLTELFGGVCVSKHTHTPRTKNLYIFYQKTSTRMLIAALSPTLEKTQCPSRLGQKIQ